MKTPKRIINLISIGTILAILLVTLSVVWYVQNHDSSVRVHKKKLNESSDSVGLVITKKELLVILQGTADIEKAEKIINKKIQDFLKRIDSGPLNRNQQYTVEEKIGGVYLEIGYSYAQSGKQAKAVEQFEKEEQIRNQYYPDLPNRIRAYDDNYVRTSKIVIPYFGSDLEAFSRKTPSLFNVFRPRTANIDFDKEMEVVIPLFEPQIIGKDAFAKDTDGKRSINYGGFIVFDIQDGRYKSFIHQISHTKTRYDSVNLEDINGDGRSEIIFSPIMKWDQKLGRYYVKNIYQFDDGVITLVDSQRITEVR